MLTVTSLLVISADRRTPSVTVVVTIAQAHAALRSTYADDLIGDPAEGAALDAMSLGELVTWCQERGALTISVEEREIDGIDLTPTLQKAVQAEVAARALAKVKDAAKDATYALISTDYDETLTPAQVDVLLRGDNEWEAAEFTDIEEAESDQRYDGVTSVLNDILDNEEFEALDGSDLMEEALEFIQERDDSDIVDSLLKTTGSMLVRYDLGVDVSTIFSSTAQESREQALQILTALGQTFDDALVPDEALITAVVDILLESGDGRAYMFWYADVEDLITAARPHQQARYGDAGTAPAATITFTDTHLLVLNSFAGSGYESRIHATFTMPFDATHLTTDEGRTGMSWNSIAGLVTSAFTADVTIAPVQDLTVSDQAPTALGERISAEFPDHDGMLDETVHDHASQAGTVVNTAGTAAQITYLLEHGETEEFLRTLLGE